MKFLINTNYVNKENEKQLKKFINNINAYSIRNKLSTFSYKNKCSTYDIDGISIFDQIVIIINDEINKDKINSLYSLYSEYKINKMVIFYKENINCNFLDFLDKKTLLKSYKNEEELGYFLLTYILLSTNEKKRYKSSSIDKIFRQKLFSFNINNLSFKDDKVYKNNLFILFKKYIYSYLTNSELLYIRNNLVDQYDSIEEDKKIKLTLKEINKQINNFNLEQKDIVNSAYDEEKLNKFKEICFKRIELHKENVSYYKKYGYLNLAYDYYFLCLYYMQIDDYTNLYYYQNIGYKYIDVYFKNSKDYFSYLNFYIKYILIHLDVKDIDYIKIIYDLNKIKIIEKKTSFLENYHNDNQIATIYALLSFSNHMINENEEANYYLEKVKKHLLFELEIDSPAGAIYQCACLLMGSSNLLSLKLMKLFLDYMENQDEENKAYYALTSASIHLSELYLNSDKYDDALFYIDKANYYMEKIDVLTFNNESLLMSKISLITGKIFYKLKKDKEDIEFHINLAMNKIIEHIEKINSTFLLYILHQDMEYILDYYKIAKNKKLIKKYIDMYNEIEDLINGYNKVNESSLN